MNTLTKNNEASINELSIEEIESVSGGRTLLQGLTTFGVGAMFGVSFGLGGMVIGGCVALAML